MDNTTLSPGGGGDSIRTLDKTGTGAPKTAVIALDLGGGDGRSEFLASSPLPVALDAPVDDDGVPVLSLSPSSMDAVEMLFRQTIAAVGAPYPMSAAEALVGITPTNMAYPQSDVRRYGAALNAVWNATSASGTDDTLAFTNAIKVASAAGGGEVIFNGSSIIKNVPLLSYVNVRGVGNSVLYLNATSASDVHFTATGVAGTAVAVTNSIAVGGATLNVANTSSFSVGQYVVVQTTGTAVPTDYVYYGGSPNYPTSNGRKQQIAKIQSIVTNTSITLDTGMFESYTGGSVQVCPLNAVTWNNATGAVIGFGIYDCINRVAIGNNGGGIQVWYGIDFIIHRNRIYGASGYPGIRTIQSAYGDIGFNRIADCQNIGTGLSTGLSHDIIESSCYINVHDNKISYSTEDEIAMRCSHCKYYANEYLGCADSGINTHGNSNSHIDITDNDIICPTGTQGIAVGYSINRTQDSNILIARNRIVNSGGKAISVASGNNAFAFTQTFTITGISKAASAVVTINTVSTVNPLALTQAVSFSGVVGMVEINNLSGSITAIGGASGAWTATVNINSTAFTAYTSGGTLTVAGSSYTITGISKAASAIITINTPSATNPMVVGQLLNVSSAGGMTQINSLTGTITAIGGSTGAWTATVNINSTAFTTYTSGGLANTANPQNGIKIIDNQIVGVKLSSGSTTPAISCTYATDLEIHGNTLDGTTIGTAPDAGITLINCVKSKLRGNVIQNFTSGYGYQLVSCTDYEIDGSGGALNNNQNNCNTANSYGQCIIHGCWSKATTNGIEAATAFSNVVSYGNSWDGTQATVRVTLTYVSGTNTAIDVSLGNYFELNITDTVAWVISAPTNAPATGGQQITLAIQNTAGASLGAATFSSAYVLTTPWTSPSHLNRTTITFEWTPASGGQWIEVNRSTAIGTVLCFPATGIETRTSTVTLTNSTQLVYVIPGKGTYALKLVVFFYATTAGTNGITANVNFSGTFTAVGSYITGHFTNGTTTTTGIQPTEISATVNNALAPFTIAATGSTSSATPCVYVVEGNLIATATGTVAFAFAQNSSGTNTTNLGVGSYMTVTQLS